MLHAMPFDELINLLSQLPVKERLTEIQKESRGDTLLILYASNAIFLKKLFSLIPDNERLSLLLSQNRAGFTALHRISLYPESFHTIYDLISEVERFTLLEAEDRNGNILLNRAAIELLPSIVNRFPESRRLEFMQKSGRQIGSILHRVITDARVFRQLFLIYPEESRFTALQKLDVIGFEQQTVLQAAHQYPETLQAIRSLTPAQDILHTLPFDELIKHLSALSIEERLVEMQKENSKGETLLILYADSYTHLRELLFLIPDNERLKILLSNNSRGITALHKICLNPESFNVVYNMLSEEDRLNLLEAEDKNGNILLYNAAIELLPSILARLPENKRLSLIQSCSVQGVNVLHRVVQHAEIFHHLFLFFPKEIRLRALQRTNSLNETVFQLAIQHLKTIQVIKLLISSSDRDVLLLTTPTEFLINLFIKLPLSKCHQLLRYLPEDSRLPALNKRAQLGSSLLHQSIDDSVIFIDILKLLPPKDRFTALQSKNKQGYTVFDVAARRKKRESLLALFQHFPNVNQQIIESDLDTSNIHHLLSFSVENTPLPIYVVAINMFFVLQKIDPRLSLNEKNIYKGIERARSNFDTLFKRYLPVFEEKYAGSLDKAERDLKKDLLYSLLHEEQFAAENGNPYNESIITLLTEENIERLALGADVALLEKARALFISKTDIYQIAWRAYDAHILTYQEPNLLVAQTQLETIYAGENQKESIKDLSFDKRKKAVFCYIAATDESEHLKDTKKDRLKQFYAAVAEYRRANNTKKDTHKLDYPCCAPGFDARLEKSLYSHPSFYLENENIEDLISKQVRIFVFNKFKEVMNSDKSVEEKNKIYASILMLGIDNLQEIISSESLNLKQIGFSGEEYTLAMLTQYRANFLREMNFEAIIKSITEFLHDEKIIINPQLVIFYIVKSILDLRGLNITLSSEQRLQLGWDQTTSLPEAPNFMDEITHYFPLPQKTLEVLKGTDNYITATGEAKESILYEQYYKPLCLHSLFLELRKKFPNLQVEEANHFILNEFLSPKPKNLVQLNSRFLQSASTIFEKFDEYNSMPAVFAQEEKRELFLENVLLEVINLHCDFMESKRIPRKRALEGELPTPKRMCFFSPARSAGDEPEVETRPTILPD